MLLEVISTSPQESQLISQFGCRIELVSALEIGGVTPSSSVIRRSLQRASSPTNVIVRHHNHSFVYSEQEKQLMIQDVIACREFGAHGVVVGSLTQHMEVDEGFMERVREEAGKMTVTFHKACDHTPDLVKTYKKLQEMKVDTILTQGGKAAILDNLPILKQIPINDKPQILLGGGVTHQNIKTLLQELHPKEVHIGTCVREPKYGPIRKGLLEEFISLIQ